MVDSVRIKIFDIPFEEDQRPVCSQALLGALKGRHFSSLDIQFDYRGLRMAKFAPDRIDRCYWNGHWPLFATAASVTKPVHSTAFRNAFIKRRLAAKIGNPLLDNKPARLEFACRMSSAQILQSRRRRFYRYHAAIRPRR